NIIGTGTLKIKDPEEIKRIRLSNLIALTVFVTGTPFAVVFYLYGSKISGIVLVFYILSFLIILQLNRKKKFEFARVVMIILLNTAVIHYSFWYGVSAGLHKMLIPFACVPFLISDRKYGWWIVFSCSISIVGYL